MERTASEPARENRSEQSRRETAPERKEGRAENDRPGLASLHRSVGNRAVQDLHERGDLQAKLAVSQPTDRSEREAERVAEEVVNGPDPVAERESVEAVETVDRQPSRGADATVDDETEAEIRSVTGGGRPLSASERSFFEPRFGRDFSDVRVHTGPQADQAARSINAEAFTLESDVVFRQGNYDPDSRYGKKLLAHELTHVVQQTGGRGGRATLQRQESEDRSKQDQGPGAATLKSRLKSAGREALKKILKGVATRVAPGAVALYEVGRPLVEAIGEGTVSGIEKARENIQNKISEKMSGFVEGVKGTGEKSPEQARQDMRDVTGFGSKRPVLAIGELETVAEETWKSVKNTVSTLLTEKLKEKVLEALNLQSAVDALKPFYDVAVKLVPEIEGSPIMGQLPGIGTKSENINAVIRNAIWNAYGKVKGQIQWPSGEAESSGT